jgi:hypothetical protein
MPLAAALNDLEKKHHLALAVDAKTSSKLGDPSWFKDSIAPATGELTLGGALDRLLLPINLDYTIRENVIWISDGNDVDRIVETRLYRIDDLMANGESIDEIQKQVVAAATNPQEAHIGYSTAAVRSIGQGWLVVAGPRSRQEDVADWLAERRTGTTPRRALERRATYERINDFDPFRSPP